MYSCQRPVGCRRVGLWFNFTRLGTPPGGTRVFSVWIKKDGLSRVGPLFVSTEVLTSRR